ncbi:hypothetical protein BCR34DRAFT_606131 [Clohesyomyces aquaticus]|uniref:Uncharacterized protein n=1 Tax=Clohesyomyces aquaticus TaxID=1231657 RepID=A0A1Y1YS87_9PLEO|nr:hypothetical protein BCR34DRAFT_606131 [Clohesyomyces aquaticus]
MALPYISNGQFIFDISYKDQDVNGAQTDLRNISCVTMYATYEARVEFNNSVQTVVVNSTDKKPLNASAWAIGELFYDVLQSTPCPAGFCYSESTFHNYSRDELSDIYHGTQIRSIRETLVYAMSGAISSFGSEGYFTTNTIIQETSLANVVYNQTAYIYIDIYFDPPHPKSKSS